MAKRLLPSFGRSSIIALFGAGSRVDGPRCLSHFLFGPLQYVLHVATLKECFRMQQHTQFKEHHAKPICPTALQIALVSSRLCSKIQGAGYHL